MYMNHQLRHGFNRQPGFGRLDEPPEKPPNNPSDNRVDSTPDP
jgi:hypothetical protein